MSEPIFPTLPGITWQTVKTPIFSTELQESASGREVAAALYANPKWKFSLSYEFLRAGAEQELQQLIGLFGVCKGRFGTFLFSDQSDNTVTDQAFAVGTGSQITFTLKRSIGAFSEPIAALNGTPTIKCNGTPVSIASINGGVITLAAPPTGNLTWSGQFYYRCRFLNDSLDVENFLYKLWQAKKVEFRSTR